MSYNFGKMTSIWKNKIGGKHNDFPIRTFVPQLLKGFSLIKAGMFV